MTSTTDERRVIVVGAGIVGSTTALLAARRGHQVMLLDRERAPWTGASAANEGKVHLGMVFALDGPATWDVMLRSALTFRPVLDEAVPGLPWDELRTEPFDYVVMPDSMLDHATLLARYEKMQERLDTLAVRHGRDYLGVPLDRLVQEPNRSVAGFPAIRTAERAIDPRRLGTLVAEAVTASPSIRVETGVHVDALTTTSDGAAAHLADGRRIVGEVAVNATWDRQEELRDPARRTARNYRLKTAALLRGVAPGRPLTLVQGPYGDVVPYDDHTFVSWYPIGRLANAYATTVPESIRFEQAELAERDDLAEEQVAALVRLGLLRTGLPVERLVGGIIVGDGAADIDDWRSRLHGRRDFGVLTEGRVLTPRSFKFTSGPLAARELVEHLGTCAGAA